ncbi:MAG TPA: tetratricopeptide repeat protein [Terriglobia bacterium]|nr:tetratricopeptide repeat protein [Terriglobia bacterium]
MTAFAPRKLWCVPAVVFLLAMPAVGQNTKQSAPESGRGSSEAYHEALNLLKAHRLTEALDVIHAGLARNPSDWQLCDLQGLVESSMGHPDAAEASFRKVIELAPTRALGYADLGVLALQLGNEEEAARLFQSALQREPDNFTARLGLGTILLALNQAQKAADLLKPAWESDPRNFRAGYEYALALRALKRSKEAHDVLLKLSAPSEPGFAAKYYALSGALAEDLEDWPAAVQDYTHAYQLAPGEIEIYSSWVRAVVKSKDSDAIRSLPAPPAGLSAEQHFSLGVLFASAGSFTQAIPEFKEVLDADPANDLAAYNLALSYLQLGNRKESIDVIHTALQQKPAAPLYNLLASVEESTGDYVQAARDFRRAVDLNPEDEEYYFDLGVEYLAHYAFRPALDVFEVGNKKFPASLREKVGLGFAHYGLHQYPEAEKAFVDALEINPSAPAAAAGWNTVTSFLTPDGYKKISERLCKLAARFPSSPKALYYCGTSLFRAGEGMASPADQDAAKNYLERSLRINPDAAAAHLELGKLYGSRNEYEFAVHQFIEAVRIDPKSAMGHYQLGQAYRKLGKLKLAQEELAQYSELSQEQQSQISHYQSEIKKFIVAETPDNRK